ncbi:uncharacterized protein CMU_026920 [Cryptosporidium muris RN66]|uniref:U4/U6.U5 small nuclear ribonucleoprotein 27kDa protein domain-containing protein n=1 Tax=Cryptosporidium muris (strain RN66) TaxID=441375 RepID=B6ABD2_CRYMR|nr:uncharacterized protein CMU_026920 [Cryptosporidium muris RN66]EEA05684.1 hypothetical protein, conserved [Cryptosporidium muris RN66]|eukprot:XP_002140033.1 hypothetical protein [Cryptosporidium muris RN66]
MSKTKTLIRNEKGDLITKSCRSEDDKSIRKNYQYKTQYNYKHDTRRYDDFGRINKNYREEFKAKDKSREIDNNIKHKEKIQKLENKSIIHNNHQDTHNELSESELIKQIIGIKDFDTSKNKDHANSDLSGVNVKSKRKYRQYMNRLGGFNRSLSPVQ